jgi:diguanylate cyclase (GGDEF)-like protein
LDIIATHLVSIAFSLIANHKGTCILYLVDIQTQKLALFKAKKENMKMIIKDKEGDIFDFWVSRHVQPLLIDNIRQDFRFDQEKLAAYETRPILSLISSPFVSGERFIGILRLDNPEPYFYTQDDLRFLAAICDVGAVALENAQLFQKTKDLAIHDSLTGLYTKGYFLERFRDEFKRSIRRNTTLSLLMLDIDYFKNYNDQFGHTAGDIVLNNLGIIMSRFFKDANPIIGRFGGEEFCVVLPRIDKKKAVSLAKELCRDIEKIKIVLRREETNITVSIGVASFPIDSRDEDDLIFKADRAMYEAKQAGRNRVVTI